MAEAGNTEAPPPPPPPPPPASTAGGEAGSQDPAKAAEPAKLEEKEQKKRDAAQALLASFMSGSSGTKRKLEEEGEGLAIFGERRRRILEAAKKAEASMGPPAGLRQPQPGAPQHNPNLPPGGNPHIMAGAGQYNRGNVPLPPAQFAYPPWTGQPAQKYFFEVYAGPAEMVNRIPIWQDRSIVIGRSPDNNLVVNHGLVSRRHAVIMFHQQDGAPMIFDMGSTHGTYLNDMTNKIPVNDGLVDRREWKKLEIGWRIMFGKCAYQYALKSEGPNPDFKPSTGPPANAAPAPAPAAPAAPSGGAPGAPDMQASALAPGVHPSRAARFRD